MMSLNIDVNDNTYKWWTKIKFSIFQMCRDSSFNPCKVTKHDMEIYSFYHVCRKNGCIPVFDGQFVSSDPSVQSLSLSQR